ncbi:MAG: hypothetical protein BWY32_00147 [bacterium ADurb.Bin243]|nr:MAG: hypothetical protein BWY32_00147 [bacterium ADurb.Bin243]HOD39110.1 hypothetical protein [Candidatus Wallbacteria bacterium]
MNNFKTGKKLRLYSLSFFLLMLLMPAVSLLTGCGGAGEESDNPDDMITIEGSIAQSVAPVFSPAGPAYTLNRSIAVEGDMVFLFLNGASVTSTQIKGGKYKFFGGYKGRKLSLKFGLTKNEVYVGVVDGSATGTITLPAFNEYHVIAKKVIEVQAAEGRTSPDNFLVSNGRLDLSATVAILKDVLSPKYLAEPDIYGNSVSDLLAKVNNGNIDVSSAFSYKKLSVFPEPQKSMVISPAGYSLGVREQGQFTVSMSGFSNKSVVYKVNDMIGGSSLTGTINSSGLYTAPGVIDSQTAVTITAQSVEDPSKQATALVSLTPLSIVINSGKPSITLTKLDKDYNVPYAVSGHNDKRLRWYVNDIEYGNILTVGYISSGGRYSQPSKIPSVKIVIKAISVADATKSASCELIITE